MALNPCTSARGTGTTTSSFASVAFSEGLVPGLTYFPVHGAGSVSVIVYNTDSTNTLSYQVLASNIDPDNTNAIAQSGWPVKVASADVANGAGGISEFDASAKFLAVQVKDKVGGSHATFVVAINHQRIAG